MINHTFNPELLLHLLKEIILALHLIFKVCYLKNLVVWVLMLFHQLIPLSTRQVHIFNLFNNPRWTGAVAAAGTVGSVLDGVPFLF